MTTAEFRAALERLGLTQVAAAKLFDASARTARRWALGEVPVPSTVAMLLHLLLRGKIKIRDINDTELR
jgi:DNA-binding transcriptional regulator YiaG